MDRPKVLTLCGSSRFMEDHVRCQKELTLRGVIVIPMGMFGHREPGFDMDGETKKMLDELHFRKIDISDGIFVVNPAAQKCPKCGAAWKHDLGKPGMVVRVVRCSCGEDLSNVPHHPYVGESTRNEIAYAYKTGKTVEHLLPPY